MKNINQVSINSEGKFLKIFFSALNESGVYYAVMRNHETLPFSVGGSDLDILVTTNDTARVKNILFESITTSGGVTIGIAESIGFFKVHVLGQITNSNERWWGLCVDISCGFHFQGLPLLLDDGKWPTQNYRDVRVLVDDFAGVLGVLREILNNAELPVKYATAARRVVQKDRMKMDFMLAPMGNSALTRFYAMLLNFHELSKESISNECKALCQDFFKYSFKQYGFRSFWSRAMYKWGKVCRYLKPSGIVLAVLGVDGAGKSTVINAILPALNAATHNAVVVQHLRPTLLPPLARLKGKKHLPVGPVLEPHGSAPSGALGSLFRLAYLTADYILGYWLKTRPQVAKRPVIYLFDRYSYDMALDPRRFRITLPTKLIRWFTRLSPKPDLIFCLYGNPDVIAARKQELPLAEVARQVDAIKEFAVNEPRAVLISTEGTVEQARDQVLEAIANYCAKRAERSARVG